MTPKLNCIYFYLTEGCNLACRHCWIKPHFQNGKHVYPSLDIKLFKAIIEQAKPLGLRSVKLTGGEPFLHPNILEILKYIRENNLRLVVETNGVLCTPDIVKELQQHEKAFVSVSLDGVNAETHEWIRGVKGSFNAAIEGMRNLVAAGFKPQIIMSIMQHNKNQIEELVRLAESLGAGSVKFNIVQPMARGETLHADGQTINIEELIKIGDWINNQLPKTCKIKLFSSQPSAFMPLSKIFGGRASDGETRCDIFGIIGVLSNGSYALCGIGKSVKELIFGDAAKDKLDVIWQTTPILNAIREGLPAKLEGICGKCVMKGRCLGNCLAQNYYRTKSIWGSNWYCEAALQAKLFPETRMVGEVLRQY